MPPLTHTPHTNSHKIGLLNSKWDRSKIEEIKILKKVNKRLCGI